MVKFTFIHNVDEKKWTNRESNPQLEHASFVRSKIFCKNYLQSHWHTIWKLEWKTKKLSLKNIKFSKNHPHHISSLLSQKTLIFSSPYSPKSTFSYNFLKFSSTTTLWHIFCFLYEKVYFGEFRLEENRGFLWWKWRHVIMGLFRKYNIFQWWRARFSF